MKNWTRFAFLALFVLIVATAFVSGCGDDDDDDNDVAADDDAADDDTIGDDDEGEPIRVALVLPTGASEAARLAAADAAELLGRIAGVTVVETASLEADALNIVLGDTPINGEVFTSSELANLPAESFRLRGATVQGEKIVAIAGADPAGVQYGLYDLLEEIGFGFFHPEQTFVPTVAGFTWPEEVDLFEAADWGRRGLHLHTMHPIEAAEFLMKDTPQHRIWAKRMIDWHVRNKQNYWQFELLRETDYDNIIDFYTELIAYSHARHVNAGVVISWVFQQQKAWKLMPSQFGGEQRKAMEAGIDRIMQAPWDHLHLEMGSTEFTPVEDTDQLAWMNNAVAYLADTYPATDASVKVHCSSGQTAENFGDINFNYLVQEADPRMGAYPHTVMYYGFEGPAPAYGNEKFNDLYDWTMSMVGTRPVYYYPETAYWCSFDIDVPLFLPLYAFKRWQDIDLLADKGLNGHVTFSSGHEWTYWLNDWVIHRSTWDSSVDWTDHFAAFTRVFGEAAPTIQNALKTLVRNQDDTLIGEELASYLASQDTWDELGFLFDTTTHPRPVQFKELDDYDAEQVLEFRERIVASLGEIDALYTELLGSVRAVGDRVPPAAKSWYDEIVDSLQVNQHRASHVYHLWEGVSARRLGELGVWTDGEAIAEEHFTAAKAVTAAYFGTMRQREAHYRYPLRYSSGWGRSVTSYDFRYLWQASTGYWYAREELQAIEKESSPFLMNVIDPMWFFF
jgi:hypothetical protein